MKKIIFVFSIFFCFTAVFSQTKPDALKHYLAGRNLDSVNRKVEAQQEYTRAIEICQNELRQTPKNMESYAVYTWSLFRLHKYADTVAVCKKALQIRQDPRVVETLGEAYFYVNQLDNSLRQMEKYINLLPTGERVSVAYFFQGEIYRIRNKFTKADIAYTAAVHFEPNIPLWWFRLGSVREAVGDKTSAIEAYSRALKISPNYAQVKEALKRLN